MIFRSKVLYTTTPSTQAAVEAAYAKAAEVCEKVWKNREGNALACIGRVRALSGTDALKEFGVRVAREVDYWAMCKLRLES